MSDPTELDDTEDLWGPRVTNGFIVACVVLGPFVGMGILSGMYGYGYAQSFFAGLIGGAGSALILTANRVLSD